MHCRWGRGGARGLGQVGGRLSAARAELQPACQRQFAPGQMGKSGQARLGEDDPFKCLPRRAAQNRAELASKHNPHHAALERWHESQHRHRITRRPFRSLLPCHHQHLSCPR